MKKLKQPNSQLTEVLYYLLKRKYINFKQIYFDTGILNLSARLSDLKLEHDLPIKLNKVKTTNKFGRKIEYGTWALLNKEKGLEVYNELIKK